ncbi:hypothetical protein PAPHI01_2056 [Pancytospora philotis]|nr:hypothetical protein PAPHI01_2056 [Pancytospora philotis]
MPGIYAEYSAADRPVQEMILGAVAAYKLPFAVRSTALLLYHRLRAYAVPNSATDCKDSSFAPARHQLGILCLFLACKFEDVHGYLDRLLMSLGYPEDGFKQLMDWEMRAFEILGFNFSYPNVYMKMQALRFLCEERGAALEPSWDDECARADKLLCSEAALQALDGACANREDATKEDACAYAPKLYNSLAIAALGAGKEAESIFEEQKIEFDSALVDELRRLVLE